MRRRLTAFGLALLVVFSSFGIAGFTMVQEVAAASCSDAKYWFNRAKWCGYFDNDLDQTGEFVRPGGVPASVNTTQELVSLVQGDLASGNQWRITAARFLILTMLGYPAGTSRGTANAQFNEWRDRLLTYGNTSQNGTTSYGTNGRIDWFVWQHMPCGARNTFYQNNQNDVAPYENHSGNSDCEVASAMDDFIIIRNTSGGEIYRLRRECMNPMGVMGVLSDNPPPNFNLTPAIGTNVNGTAGAVAELGDQVTFTYTVRNTGSTASTSVACNTIASTHSGYRANGSAPPGGSPAGPNPGCPRVFNVGTTTVATENITVNTPNQTVCRTLTVNPATFGGGARTTNEICVIVASKPYLKVFGGDVSVGNGLEGTLNSNVCTNFANAGIMAWNKNTGATGYAGAGAQYAAYALQTISYFSTAQGNAGGAPTPNGLAFANTSAVSGGNYGGNFGTAKCIPNYWARRPAAVQPLPPDISSMVSNVYGATGNITFSGGNVSSGEKVSVYIDGNVYITGNISYPGAWTAANVPLFELVVRGNIYIAGGVTQLDGIYIAQRNGATGGTIYTCASGFSAPTLTGGAFYNGCTNKLTVNGVFIANSVEFLRTGGSLSQSSAGESSAANSAGEVFNFGPSLWITQPLDTSGRVDNYDAITTLPPVL